MPIAWPTKSAQSGMRTLAVVLPEVTKSATSPTDLVKPSDVFCACFLSAIISMAKVGVVEAAATREAGTPEAGSWKPDASLRERGNRQGVMERAKETSVGGRRTNLCARTQEAEQ